MATVANTYGDIVESGIDKPFWFLIFSPMYITGNDTQGSEAGEYILGFQWSRENWRLRIGYVRNTDQSEIFMEQNGSLINVQ